MTDTLTTALHLLAHFWLEEPKGDDIKLIMALPDLAQTLSETSPAALTDLAVEYQRLFGFNLPPYETIFTDTSMMLMAPSLRRVQQLYHEGQWSPPDTLRIGAPDHLGIELLALVSWRNSGQSDLAYRLHTRHLALWAPLFIFTLQRLTPHPFYAALGELTLAIILDTLPERPLEPDTDPFPRLSITTGSSECEEIDGINKQRLSTILQQHKTTSVEMGDRFGLRDIINYLLTPCESGLYLTRHDIATLYHRLSLSTGLIGERAKMLEDLFRAAGQYEVSAILFDQLDSIFEDANLTYSKLNDEYPQWEVYARAWQKRVNVSRELLTSLGNELEDKPRVQLK